MRNFNYFLFLILIFVSSTTFAQTRITGRVTDAETKETLVGVVISTNQLQGTTTDIDGNYYLTVDADETILTAQFLGYETQVITVKLNDKSIVQDIELGQQTSILNTVTVTSSRNRRLIEDEVATVEIIPAKFIENNAVNSLSEVMERTPGVQILDNQVSIRSSGFSYGGGSRVGLIVDGQPMLSALFSDVPWNFVPIENAGQIEVVKGPASVLYGSNSMNGIINVTTADPTSDPYTSIMLYRGQMDNPPSKYRQWWADGEAPYNAGLFFAHRVKATDKLDVTLGGNLHYNLSHIQKGDEARYRFNWKTKYRLSDRTTLGINGNIMYHKLGGYFIWEDADTNALKHISPLSFSRYQTYSIDPHFTHFDGHNNKHSVKGRIFSITEVQSQQQLNTGVTERDGIPSNIFSVEYQFQRRFDNQLLLTSGILLQTYQADNPTLAFTDADSLSRVTTTGQNQAIFGQVERSFFDNKLNAQIGLRIERFATGENDYQAYVPALQIGASYKLTPTNVFRGSFGQGYRMPSLLERYVEADVFNIDAGLLGNFPINAIPNLEIRPEYGWSLELGYKKLLKKGNWKGYFDAAFFVMQYRDMAELTLDVHLSDEDLSVASINDIREAIGFKYINKTFGRIAGFEVGTHLNGEVLGVPVRIWGGYTYTYPGDLDSIEANEQNFWSNFADGINTPDSSMLNTVMIYRNFHTTRFDIEFDLFKRLTLGGVVTYNSFMHNIDAVFEGKGEWGTLIEILNDGPLIPGTKEFRTSQLNGDIVFDFRANFLITEGHRVHFIVTNAMNREYALRVGRMNALRMFHVKYQMTF